MKSLRSMFVCTVCFALVVFSANATANLVSNPGFENPEGTSGEYPYVYGNWEGDVSEIVQSENGIVPLEGSRMLHFIYGAGDYGAYSTTDSQVRQTINISDYASLIASGHAVAQLSAQFNRVAGDAQTDTRFYVRIDAFAGQVNNYMTLARNKAQLAYSIGEVLTDADTDTWEMAMTELLIPSNTDFIAIQVVASENIYNDYVAPEFDGHYCDMVTLEIIPEPATLSLLALGAVFLRRKK